MTRCLMVLSFALWAAALGRDSFDSWIDATVLPHLITEQSVEVRDRNGDLLRAFMVAGGRWRMGVNLGDVDPTYIDMLLRYEDKRFFVHAGVDIWALARGAAQAFRTSKITSGGSTITMQVARLLENGSTGAWQGKLRQIRVALALERQRDKEGILTLYLNLAPFGGNIEGVRAASLAWFGKPPRRLTPAQAALLVALPQSPENRRPDRHAEAATAARDRVLLRMVGAGVIDDNTGQAAMRLPVPATRHPFPANAPHVADRVVAASKGQHLHILTLDRDLQMGLERLAAEAVEGRSDRLQVAMLVADHQTGEILASVGSAAYRADGRAGFIDLTRAVRSPGSTLKPLVYGLGFDQGLIHPETLIADRPVDFDGYAPQNFDGLYRGELRVRTALQLSLNIPVVSITRALGPQHLIAGLQRAGTAPKLPGGQPGLAVALGGVGLTLEDLTRLYAGIANMGKAVDLRVNTESTPGFIPHQIIGNVAAWEVADILLETPRPLGVQATGIAFKTGTSYGHRDTWAIGFDGRHVVGVWMGRADGTPVPGAFGGELAAPVMFAAFGRLKLRADPIAAPPPATLLIPTSRLPAPLKRFGGGAVFIADNAPTITFPPDGAELLDRLVVAKVRAGAPPFTWLTNGHPVTNSHSREVDLGDLGPGFSRLTVIDANGRSATAQISLR